MMNCNPINTFYLSSMSKCVSQNYITEFYFSLVYLKSVDSCKDPGIPPGALRSGSRFQVGDRVSYRCEADLDLLGASQRVCLSSREWTGSAPRCQGREERQRRRWWWWRWCCWSLLLLLINSIFNAAYSSFDSPNAVVAMMTGSLSGVMDALSPKFQKNGECHLYPCDLHHLHQVCYRLG